MHCSIHTLRRILVGVAWSGGFLLSPGPVSAQFGDVDGDGTWNISEYAAGSDGASPASQPESLQWDATLNMLGTPTCSDLIDNDLDGAIDGADLGCINSDGDSLSGVFPMDDQTEIILGSDPFSAASLPEFWAIIMPSSCNDGIDNDVDGLTDLADPACTRNVDYDSFADTTDSEGCTLPNTNGAFGSFDCTDGEDNDGDGLTDAADPGCVMSDVDADGVVDGCDSEGPQSNDGGVGGHDDCFDGVDNDGDGATDYPFDGACGLCFGQTPTIVGTTTDDVIVGTSASDVILALQGNDRINGAQGDDLICAGPGNDRVTGGPGDDLLGGSDGDDVLRGGGSSGVNVNYIQGDSGADRIAGTSAGDILYGGPGDDVIAGRGGADFLYGGDGDDRLLGGGDDDTLVGFTGDDDLVCGGGNDYAEGDAGDDELRGGGGDDALVGGDDNDALIGGGGTDSCDGQGGVADSANPTCEAVTAVP